MLELSGSISICVPRYIVKDALGLSGFELVFLPRYSRFRYLTACCGFISR